MRSFDVPVCRYDRLVSQMLGPDNLLDSGLHAIACQLLVPPTILATSFSGTVKFHGREIRVALRSPR